MALRSGIIQEIEWRFTESVSRIRIGTEDVFMNSALPQATLLDIFGRDSGLEAMIGQFITYDTMLEVNPPLNFLSVVLLNQVKK